MKKVILIILLIFSLTLNAQEREIKNNQLTLSGALDSNSAWEIEFSYMRRLSPYVGLGAGVNLYHQYYDEISANGPDMPGAYLAQWVLSDESKRATGMVFNPFVHLNTPALFKVEDLGVNIFAEPGLSMAFLTDKNVEVDYWNKNDYYYGKTFYGHGGDWLYWNCRIGIAMENEDGCLQLGYFASNIDMYSYKRNIKIENIRLGDDLPTTHFNWGIFISLGCKL